MRLHKMKNYKSYPKRYIGSSDCGKLALISPKSSLDICFGEDGSYYAYIVDEKCKIGNHYRKKAEFCDCLTVHDDEGIVESFTADKIIVYQAGAFGCIIQLLGSKNKADFQ